MFGYEAIGQSERTFGVIGKEIYLHTRTGANRFVTRDCYVIRECYARALKMLEVHSGIKNHAGG
jgi:hypothetical protein